MSKSKFSMTMTLQNVLYFLNCYAKIDYGGITMPNKITYDNIYTVAERKELISEMLKFNRIANRYTQNYVAEQLGINAQTYATYERGRNEPPAEILVRLSYLYDCPIDVLVQRDAISKNTRDRKKQFNQYRELIDEVQKKVLSGDKATREQLKALTDTMGSLIDVIEKISESDNKE